MGLQCPLSLRVAWTHLPSVWRCPVGPRVAWTHLPSVWRCPVGPRVAWTHLPSVWRCPVGPRVEWTHLPSVWRCPVGPRVAWTHLPSVWRCPVGPRVEWTHLPSVWRCPVSPQMEWRLLISQHPIAYLLLIHRTLRYCSHPGVVCVFNICSLLPGNQILISKYLARRGVVVSGGWSNGSGWQQTTATMYTSPTGIHCTW